MIEKRYDRVIIGGGIYGLYSALYCGKRGLSVIVLEQDDEFFKRATYINQARVHMGYHYPRSLTTAIKSAGYFNRFVEDFDFCIHKKFEQIYATSEKFSWTQADQFKEFCQAAGIRCDEIAVSRYFKEGTCDGAFLTEEYTYDAHVLRDYFLEELRKLSNVALVSRVDLKDITRDGDDYKIVFESKDSNVDSITVLSSFVLNATYASVNQILGKIFPNEMFKIKYELCEIILCKPESRLKDIGITVMDGPFFSIMPFGLTGLHSLTSVNFTPHITSYEDKPSFKCQEGLNLKYRELSNSKCMDGFNENEFVCTSDRLGNCNVCPNKPKSAWEYMSHLAKKYLKDEYQYTYEKSLFSMKPILKSSEVDDSRPTCIKVHSGGKESKDPTFISVLSGKINTVYDLDEYLV